MVNETQDVKPSYKSLEGQSLIGVLLGGLYFLKEVLGDSKLITLSPEDITKYAANIHDVVSSTDMSWLNDVTSTGKSGIILFFMYKIYIKFLNSRTEIKKEALKNKTGSEG